MAARVSRDREENPVVQRGYKTVKFERGTRDHTVVKERMTRDHDQNTDNISKKNVN